MVNGTEHLSDAQLEHYGTDSLTVTSDDAQKMEAHLEHCGDCRARMLEHQRVRFALLTDLAMNASPKVEAFSGSASSVGASDEKTNTHDFSESAQPCISKNDPTSAIRPSEDDLRKMAAGLVSAKEALAIARHAEECPRCGTMLRAFREDFSDDLTPEEAANVSQLKSSTPAWQKEMAKRAVKANTGDQADAGNVAAANMRENFTRKTSGARIFSWPMRRVLAPAAIAASALIAFGLWFTQRDTPEKVEKLLAQAYTEHRTMEYRWPGAEWGPVRVKRGSQESALTAPLPLLEAERILQGHRTVIAEDAAWLAALGELELLEGRLQKAIDDSSRAIALGETSPRTKMILAIAYAQLGSVNDDRSALLKSTYLLTEMLSANSEAQATLLYNRSLVYRQLKMYDEADADRRAFQGIERQSQWEMENQPVR